MTAVAAYYNEIDPFAAQWLRNMIDAGHIAAGEVDERSITEVRPEDLRPFQQCHFFAGIGGWSLAARLAGIPDDYPLWTGSCPCQPLSCAGQRRGHADERHLWPAFYALISECRPATVAGEQVASRLGREWFSAVRADLEHVGYAVGAADLPAAGVGAPHIRQRLFWLANGNHERYSHLQRASATGVVRHGEDSGAWHGPECGNADGGMADTGGPRLARRQEQHARSERTAAERGSNAGGIGDTDRERETSVGKVSARQDPQCGRGPWVATEWLPCRDGKARPTQPGLFPLAHGVPGRVGRLRAYGNAIVPQVAAAFLTSALA